MQTAHFQIQYLCYLFILHPYQNYVIYFYWQIKKNFVVSLPIVCLVNLNV